MQGKIDVLADKVEVEKTDRKESIEKIIAAKATIKFELNQKLTEENQKIHDRITKTQDHHEKGMKNVDREFKAINTQLSEIQTGIGRIEGKLERP